MRLFQDLLLAGCEIDDQSTNTSSAASCTEYIGIERWLCFFVFLFGVWYFWCVGFALSFLLVSEGTDVRKIVWSGHLIYFLTVFMNF